MQVNATRKILMYSKPLLIPIPNSILADLYTKYLLPPPLQHVTPPYSTTSPDTGTNIMMVRPGS